MIPKIIHYCWFGNNPISTKHQSFIDGWKDKLIDYNFKLWNESNTPMSLSYLKKAYKNKNWANISNYVRLYAIYQEGGIYLDTDIEVLKSFDDLLNQRCFLGFEVDQVEANHAINNAVIGAIPKHPVIGEIMDKLLQEFDGTEQAHLSSPVLTTRILRDKGLNSYGDQYLDDVHLYPKEYFYPFAWNEQFSPECIQDNTYCVHFMDMSWKKPAQNFSLVKFMKSIIHNLRKNIA